MIDFKFIFLLLMQLLKRYTHGLHSVSARQTDMTLKHNAGFQCTVWTTAHEAPGPKAPTPLILCWRRSWLRLCQFLFPGPSRGPEGAQYMQMWAGSRSGSLPSRSSMAPASMMSSSSSSSGPSSSWGWAKLPHLRGRPFLPAAAAGGGGAGYNKRVKSDSWHPMCAGGQASCYQRTWAEVPLPHVAQQRGLGAAPVLAHLALELLYHHHLHHGLQALQVRLLSARTQRWLRRGAGPTLRFLRWLQACGCGCGAISQGLDGCQAMGQGGTGHR